MARREALDEIQDRLNELYNNIRLEGETEKTFLLQAQACREKIGQLELLAEGYVALLRPTEGEASG